MSVRRLRVDGVVHETHARLERGRLLVGDPPEEHEVRAVAPGEWELRSPEGRVRTLFVARRGATWWVHVDGRTHAVEAVTGKRVESAGSLHAPMTCTVLDVLVAEGDRVEPGQALVVLSAMKMQLEVKSPVAGRVRRVVHGKGEQVEGGAELVVVDEDAPRDATP